MSRFASGSGFIGWRVKKRLIFLTALVQTQTTLKIINPYSPAKFFVRSKQLKLHFSSNVQRFLKLSISLFTY